LKFLSDDGGNSCGGFGFGESALEFGSGGRNFWSVNNDGRSNGENVGRSNRDVSSSNPESVDGVSDVVDALEESVGIDVAVGTASDTVRGVDLLLGRVDVLVAVVEGAEFVLAVVLNACGADDGESVDWGCDGEGCCNWKRCCLNLGNEGSGDGSDELRSGGLDKMGDWCWLGNEKLGWDSVGDDPDGCGGGQKCWSFGEVDGFNRCKWNSIPWINGRCRAGYQEGTQDDQELHVVKKI
jgi:hypothetical protein